MAVQVGATMATLKEDGARMRHGLALAEDQTVLEVWFAMVFLSMLAKQHDTSQGIWDLAEEKTRNGR